MLLAGLVAGAAALVVAVRAPERRTGLYAVRGHRVFGVGRSAVIGVDVQLDDRRFAGRQIPQGWEIDGRRASPGTADALNDLLDTLVRLRAIDAFRSRDPTSFGLDRPRGTIELLTVRGPRRVLIGGLTTAGSAFYAQRADDPRILQVGTLLLGELDRVFYNRDRAGASPDG